jgi:uncharacterized protein (DUF983 family)
MVSVHRQPDSHGSMLELLNRTRWDQAYDFLAAGDPPMMLRILGVNTLFFIFYMIRRTQINFPMKQHTVIQVQAFLLLANALILFQHDIIGFLGQFI